MSQQDHPGKEFASSPCSADEFEQNSPTPDPQDKQQVSLWRKEQRKIMLGARMRHFKELEACATAVVSELTTLIEARPGLIISVYWPMRGELDLRDWMQSLVDQQMRVALPVVETKAQPMIFREWTPNARIEPGIWNIPVPVDGEQVIPDVTIAPLVGFDAGCYRLGYGGGYFDRTLASLPEKPLVIGIGPELCEIETIYPQPYDIPMDIIVTGSGQPRYRKA